MTVDSLGPRLREIRRDAGLTGRRLARLAGWHESKVSKIENGKQKPSEKDLRTWCTHAGSLNQLPDLVCSVRNIGATYTEFCRVLDTGTVRQQKYLAEAEDKADHIRCFEPCTVPGLLQTPAYFEWALAKVIGFYGTPNDLTEGQAAGLERQNVLFRSRRQFTFLIAEQVLRTTVRDDLIMVGQLDRLLTVMSLPRLVLGIVPEKAAHVGPASNGFVIYNDGLVGVDTVSAQLSITQPGEIALYERMFTLLSEQAVHGEVARELIGREIAARRTRLDLTG